MQPFPALPVATALLLGLGSPVLGQSRSIDLAVGRWWIAEPATTYAVTYSSAFLGPIGWSLAGVHLDDSRSLDNLTRTGVEAGLRIGGWSGGPYLLGTVGFAVRHEDGNADAAWSGGLGYQLRLLSFLALGIQGRYRVEDREVAGFWRLTPVDRRGFEVSAQLGVLTGRSRRPRDPVRPDPRIPARPGIPAAVNDGTRVDEDAAALASRIVSTALDAMGTPYRWGGSDVNGFDCSGLIQFAYGEHGILLPRMSRDQARLGIGVPRDPASLRPGDILGFSESGSGVTHVGLYVGDGAFIHSSSTGVKLSYLDATDGDSRWWRERWTTVRRILT